MANVLEEVTADDITPEHVERRVADWADRIDSLYSRIESWLPDGWTAKRGRPVTMHEPMMKEFHVAPRDLPTLDLFREGEHVASIEPRGLWIIGANGRLDVVIARGEHYVIDDRAENFADPSWTLAPYSDRLGRQPLNRETLLSAL